MRRKILTVIVLVAIVGLALWVNDTNNSVIERQNAERSVQQSQARIEAEEKAKKQSEFNDGLNKLKAVCATEIAAYNKLPDAKPGVAKVPAPDCNPNLTLPQ